MPRGSYVLVGVTLVACFLVGGALPLAMGGSLPTSRLTAAIGVAPRPADLTPTGDAALAVVTSTVIAVENIPPTPTVLPTATVAPPTPAPTRTPPPPTPTTQVATATAQATAAPPTETPIGPAAGAAYYVANTGGRGVHLRDATSIQSRQIRAWSDATPLVATGKVAQAEGVTWFNVRDPLGNVGWVSSQWLSSSKPAPAATSTAIPTAATPR